MSNLLSLQTCTATPEQFGVISDEVAKEFRYEGRLIILKAFFCAIIKKDLFPTLGPRERSILEYGTHGKYREDRIEAIFANRNPFLLLLLILGTRKDGKDREDNTVFTYFPALPKDYRQRLLDFINTLKQSDGVRACLIAAKNTPPPDNDAEPPILGPNSGRRAIIISDKPPSEVETGDSSIRPLKKKRLQKSASRKDNLRGLGRKGPELEPPSLQDTQPHDGLLPAQIRTQGESRPEPQNRGYQTEPQDSSNSCSFNRGDEIPLPPTPRTRISLPAQTPAEGAGVHRQHETQGGWVQQGGSIPNGGGPPSPSQRGRQPEFVPAQRYSPYPASGGNAIFNQNRVIQRASQGQQDLQSWSSQHGGPSDTQPPTREGLQGGYQWSAQPPQQDNWPPRVGEQHNHWARNSDIMVPPFSCVNSTSAEPCFGGYQTSHVGHTSIGGGSAVVGPAHNMMLTGHGQNHIINPPPQLSRTSAAHSPGELHVQQSRAQPQRRSEWYPSSDGGNKILGRNQVIEPLSSRNPRSSQLVGPSYHASRPPARGPAQPWNTSEPDTRVVNGSDARVQSILHASAPTTPLPRPSAEQQNLLATTQPVKPTTKPERFQAAQYPPLKEPKGRTFCSPIPWTNFCLFLSNTPAELSVELGEHVVISNEWLRLCFKGKKTSLELAEWVLGPNASIENLVDSPPNLSQISGYLQSILGINTAFFWYGRNWTDPLAEIEGFVEIEVSTGVIQRLIRALRRKVTTLE